VISTSRVNDRTKRITLQSECLRHELVDGEIKTESEQIVWHRNDLCSQHASALVAQWLRCSSSWRLVTPSSVESAACILMVRDSIRKGSWFGALINDALMLLYNLSYSRRYNHTVDDFTTAAWCIADKQYHFNRRRQTAIGGGYMRFVHEIWRYINSNDRWEEVRAKPWYWNRFRLLKTNLCV
jgi:hypothetical protein